LNIATKNLFYTNIYSPIDGVVLNRNVSAGQTIASSFNAPTLFVIAKDLTKMQVRAAVDEADIGGVRAGQKVTFTVDAFPEEVFNGTVREILLHPSITANVVTYKTLINVANFDLKLKPGMTANSTIYTEIDLHTLLLPSRALTYKPDSITQVHFKIVQVEKKRTSGSDQQKQHTTTTSSNNALVWVKNGTTLEQKAITIGSNDDENVKVISGLQPQDEVIIAVSNTGKPNNGNDAQRSPFVPKMPRRGGASRN